MSTVQTLFVGNKAGIGGVLGTETLNITGGCNLTSGNDYKINNVKIAFSNLGGTAAVSQGGTGATTLTSGRFLEGNGVGAVITTKVVPTGDVVGTTDIQTLSNKTITATTNSVRASELATTGASVVLTGGAPPSINQALIAQSATTANWQDIPDSFPGCTFVSSSTLISTSLTTFQLMPTLTISPADGTYAVWVNGTCYNDNKDRDVEISIYYNGSIVTDTESRATSRSSSRRTTVSTMARVVVSGGGAIEGRYRAVTNTANVTNRRLMIIQCS